MLSHFFNFLFVSSNIIYARIYLFFFIANDDFINMERTATFRGNVLYLVYYVLESLVSNCNN